MQSDREKSKVDLLDQAVYDTAHSATGGLNRLAHSMGLSHQVLINKVNFNNEQNKLSLREAISMMEITENYSVLEEASRMLGFKTEPLDAEPEKSLLSAILNVSADHGQVHQTIETAVLDQKISSRELRKISQDVDDAIDALHGLRATIEKEQSKL